MTETETSHEHGHQTPSYDDINTPVIVLVGAISALVTLITIMFVQGLSYHWTNNYTERLNKQVENMPAVIKIEEQKAALAGGDKIVSIDDAKKKVIAKYGTPANN